MSETSPTSSEKTVVVANNSYCRLWTLTIASLVLNGLILVLLAVGLILHHHHHHKRHHGFGRQGGQQGFCSMAGQGNFGRGFHRFQGGFGPGQEWGRPNGFGRGGFDRREAFENGGGNEMGSMDGGPGMRGMGMGRGMMGGKRNGPPDPAMMTDMMLARLSNQLTLTDDQKAKIKPIIEAQVTQAQKDREAERAARQKAMEDTKAKIRAILTPDQQKQLDAMKPPGDKGADQAAPKPGQ